MIVLARSRCALRYVRHCVLFMVAASMGLAAQAAQPASLAQLAPEAATVYVEIAQPQALVNTAREARWQTLLGQNEKWQAFWRSPDGGRFKAGVRTIEDQLQMPWHQALSELTGGGLAVAADPFERRSLLLVRAQNADILAKVRQLAINFGELASLASGKPSPLQASNHRGVEVWDVAGQAAYALVPDKKLLIAGNRREDVIAAVDRLLDGGRSLADESEFKAAQTANAGNDNAWGWLQLEKFRSLPQWENLQTAPRGNVATESLLGGLMEALDRASYLAVQAKVTDGRLAIRWQVPFDREKLSANRQWCFARAGENAGPALIQPEGTILSVSMYRDLAQMWQLRDQLFDQDTLAKLNQVDGSLSMFFANRDFGSQVLGELQPGSRLIVARQKFADGQPVPTVKLPAFALLLELKNPGQFSPALVAAYQTAVGLANFDGVQKGNPQLLQQTTDYRGATLYQARYLTPPGEPQQTVELIYNFSPTCAMVKNHFIIASTAELARQLIDELQRDETARATNNNVQAVLNLEHLAAVLTDNEQALVTQNMLTKGNTRAEAQSEVALVLRVLRELGTAELRLTPADGRLELETRVGLPKLE
jgi:hypothetical protein